MTRHIAHITIEANTPLKVGSNESDFLQDSPVQKDWNGLPMILGTSIAGVLRKEFSEDEANGIFGNNEGSRVIFSNALLLDENNEINEELLSEKSNFLKIFDNLPIREHTAITDKGIAKEHSKFDEEIVYEGAKFKFSIEMIDDKEAFIKVLNQLYNNHFRLGGGSTKGFGSIKIEKIEIKEYDKDTYQDYSSSLNYKLSGEKYTDKNNSKEYTTYTLKIKPDDFFMFGSGFGDSYADMTPVYEKVVDYDKVGLSDEMMLIPASSIKGAIAHRTTYHYNFQNKLFIGNSEAKKSIKEIFGEAKNSKKEIQGCKGKILISDCFKTKADEKIFDHVSIDRFTGGAIDGALFQEKTIADCREYEIEILEKNIDEEYVEAFENALKDITTGMLSLGGATTKGHGIFSGTILKDGVEL